MGIQHKITGLAGLGVTWAMWLVIGLSIGGLAFGFERAFTLLWSLVRRPRFGAR